MTAFVLSAVLAVAAQPDQKADEEFAKKLNAAREKAVGYLKKERTPDGHWEKADIGFLADMKGGPTALVALAMLEVGVPADDAAITKAVEYLVNVEPKKTYVVSLQTQVLARVDAKKHAKQIQANADWLIKNALGWRATDDGKATRVTGELRGWSYPQHGMADNSNTHFAVMGLHAAAQAGAKIDAKVWKDVRDFYARTQRQDGGWSYYNEESVERPSVSMTTCALLGLAVATKYDKEAKGPGEAFEKGMPAMLKLWGPSTKSETYRLFATAELGRALDVKEFKAGKQTRAWYREDAEKLVKEQKEDGSWSLGRSVDGTPHLATAFALYFLGPPKKP